MPGGAFKDQIWLYSYHTRLAVGHIFIGKELLAAEVALLFVVNGDALVALRFALLRETPTQGDIEHGDVAPLDGNGLPNPDGLITVGDALVILRKALGIIGF